MASENPSLDPKLELQDLVSNLCFSAKKEEKELENLLDRVNSVIESRGRSPQSLYLLSNVKTLKIRQQSLSKEYSDTGMKFFQMVDQDCDYSSFQKVLRQELDDLHHGKRTITDEKISGVKKDLELYGRQQDDIKKKREVLDLEFQHYLTWESRNLSNKEDNYDHNEIGTGTGTGNGAGSIGKAKFSENWWSFRILEEFEKDSNSSGLEPWNLEKVLTRIHGFSLDKEQREFELNRRLEEAVVVACDERRSSLNRSLIKRKRSKLEALLFAIRATTRSRDHIDELRQAKGVLIEWLGHIELEILFASIDLIVFATHHDNRGSERLRDSFRNKLLELNQQRGGRVSIMVYRLMTYLETDWSRRSRNDVDDTTTENSLMIQTITHMFEVHICKTILWLMAVLHTNVGLCCPELGEKEVLMGCVAIVEKCNDKWRAMKKDIDEKISKYV